MLSIEERIRIIEESSSFADIPQDVMPPSHKENYYFISYSHKDYKEVLRDILYLEAMGINVWYDHDMHIGENWREIAQMYISKFQCAGVIFYLTENSITSPACNQEVEYVLTHNKKYLSINKALDGCSSQSGYDMLLTLINRGFNCQSSLLENFQKAFSSDILYLPIDEDIQNKAHKIQAIPKESLLKLNEAGEYISLDFCRDNTILSLDLSQKFQCNEFTDYIQRINACVFTNCIKLQKVTVSPKLKYIGENSFRNCISLESIDLSQTSNISIGNRAFQNCTALTFIDISKASEIGDSAFCDCSNLNIRKISGRIGSHAFYRTNITEIDYVDPNPRLERSAFSDCDLLRVINIPGKFTTDLGEGAFYGCRQLTHVGPFVASADVSLRSPGYLNVGAWCFTRCEQLKSVRFKGPWSIASAKYAFNSCNNLTKIEMEQTGSHIPEHFSEGCCSLEKFITFDHITHIDMSAFKGCSNLREFDLEHVVVLGEETFAYTGLKTAYLKNVQEIGESAFCGAEHLRSVYIGADCRIIQSYAFKNCIGLNTVKILSEDIVFESVSHKHDTSIFDGADVKIFYLRSPAVFRMLEETGLIEKLKHLYIGDNVDLDQLDVSSFIREESDEFGFYKFTHDYVDLSLDDEEDIDISNPQINAPDPHRKKYHTAFMLDGTGCLHYLGKEVQIKHSRLSKRYNYFIEQLVADTNGNIDYLIVSIHNGKSFRLDGSVIDQMYVLYPEEPSKIRISATKEPDILKHFFAESIETELNGKPCCIQSFGKSSYCTILGVAVHVTEPPLSRPIRDKDGLYSIQAIYYQEKGVEKAISGTDIDAIIVFDKDYKVSRILTPDIEQ